MGIQERKEREKAEMQEKILQAADEIMKSDGLGGISIRKIAEKIEYSPAIVYHYFKDKEEIINQLIARTYKSMVKVLADSKASAASPEEAIKVTLRNFINLCLSMGEEYKMIMLSESPHILARTSVLHKGAVEDRPTVEMFCGTLKELFDNRITDDGQIELIAQTIWAAMFGLILRLIIEKVDEAQKNRLIDCFFDFLLNAIHSV